MSIRVECPSCGKGIKAPDKYAGKRAKCPGCGVPMMVPIPEAKVLPPAEFTAEPVLQASIADATTIEATGKKWKLMQLVGIARLTAKRRPA